MRSVPEKEYVTVLVHSMYFLSYTLFGTNMLKRKKYNGLQIKKIDKSSYKNNYIYILLFCRPLYFLCFFFLFIETV